MRFLFVDKILALSPGESIKALKRVKADEDYFKDHFPGFPVVPGVLLIEMMAQTAGKCLDAEKRSRGKAMLARIKSASFREWVGPDQDAITYCHIKTNRAHFATADCHIEVGNITVCNAELLFSFVPLDKFAPGYMDHVLESYLTTHC